MEIRRLHIPKATWLAGVGVALTWARQFTPLSDRVRLLLCFASWTVLTFSLAGWSCAHFETLRNFRHSPKGKSPMTLAIVALFGAGVMVLIWLLVAPLGGKSSTAIEEARSKPAPTPMQDAGRENNPKPRTLHDLFEHDFGELSARLPGSPETHYPGGPEKMEAFLLIDLNSNAKWMSFYIPPSAGTYEISKSLADSYKTSMDEISGRQRLNWIAMRSPGESASRRFGDAAFTGQIYIYHELEMEPRQVADLLDWYKAKGLTLQLRGQAYRATASAIK
jgi:hypothetical protein